MDRIALSLLLIALAGCGEEPPPERDGRTVFLSICARCHGRDGRGGLPLADGSRPRDFTDSAWQASREDADLRVTVAQGRGMMPAFATALTPGEIDAVVAYVRGFRARRGDR